MELYFERCAKLAYIGSSATTQTWKTTRSQPQSGARHQDRHRRRKLVGKKPLPETIERGLGPGAGRQTRRARESVRALGEAKAGVGKSWNPSATRFGTRANAPEGATARIATHAGEGRCPGKRRRLGNGGTDAAESTSVLEGVRRVQRGRSAATELFTIEGTGTGWDQRSKTERQKVLRVRPSQPWPMMGKSTAHAVSDTRVSDFGFALLFVQRQHNWPTTRPRRGKHYL